MTGTKIIGTMSSCQIRTSGASVRSDPAGAFIASWVIVMRNSRRIFSLLMVIAGNILYTFSIKLFLLPANLMSCGTTGIALVVNYFLNIPMTGFIFAFNFIFNK